MNTVVRITCWLLLVITAAITAVGIIGCAAFSPEDKVRIEKIQDDIVSLVQQVESGELTIGEAHVIAARLQSELEALKVAGHNWWEIISGLVGAFLLGALGIKSPGAMTLVKSAFGKPA